MKTFEEMTKEELNARRLELRRKPILNEEEYNEFKILEDMCFGDLPSVQKIKSMTKEELEKRFDELFLKPRTEEENYEFKKVRGAYFKDAPVIRFGIDFPIQ